MILPINEKFDLLVSAIVPGGKHALTEQQYALLKQVYFSGFRDCFISTIADPEGDEQTSKDVLDAIKQIESDLNEYFSGLIRQSTE